MGVLGVILRILLKLGTCVMGGGLVAWIVVGGLVSLFFSTKVMLKKDFIAEHEYWHNRPYNVGKCSTCESDIIEELPHTPIKNDSPGDKRTAFDEMDAIAMGRADTLNNSRVRVKYRPDWAAHAQGFAVYVGLLCGIAWAIENNKARWRFFWSTCGGASLGWVVHLATGNTSVCWAFIVLGLFVGVVSALASVGAYSRK